MDGARRDGTQPQESADDGQAHDWRAALTAAEQATVARAGFALRVGIGARAAVLVIDVQNYMIGPPAGSTVTDYPSACGPAGRRALARLATFLPRCRELGVPIVYTRFELRRDGSDAGVYQLKRRLLQGDGWCLEGTEGADIVADVAPSPLDTVLVKKKPSAFHGTPLLGLLIAAGIDTVVVTGGSTSNCVRASVVDAVSYNYRTIIVEDCVFDRFPRSHVATLFDLDRQYGDVVPAADVLTALESAREQ